MKEGTASWKRTKRKIRQGMGENYEVPAA